MANRSIESGNALADGNNHRGWFVGYFVDPTTLRYESDVEVKWALQRAGEGDEEFASNRTAKSLTVLISGELEVIFPETTVLLQEQGDYVIWAAETPHRWRTLVDSIVLTIRWPSIEGDQYLVDLENHTQST